MSRQVSNSSRLKSFFRVLQTLMFSCTPVILISLCVAIMLTFNSLNLINRETERATRQNFSNIVGEVEGIYSYAGDINRQLISEKDIVDYASAERRNYYHEYYITHELLDSTILNSRYSLVNMLYLEEYDYILSEGWGAERSVCFSAEESAELRSIVNEVNASGSRRLSAFKVVWRDENDFSPMLVFARAIRSGEKTCYVITKIDARALKRSVQDMLWDSRNHIVVYNSKGVVLSTMTDEATREFSGLLNGVSEAADLEETSFLWDGQRYSLSYIKSDVSGLTYTIAVCQSTTSANFVRNTAIITIVTIVLLAVFLIVYVSWLNFQPLQRVLQKFGIHPTGKDDGYQAIESTVRSYIERNYALNKQIQKSENDLRNLYMEKLLEGRIVHMENISELLNLYNIDLPYRYLMVTVFQATENVSFLSGHENSGEGRGAAVEALVLSTLERRRINVRVYSLEINDGSVFVFNGDEEKLQAIGKIAAGQIAGAAQDWLNSEYSVSSSCIYEGVEKLPQAYREALQMAARSEQVKDEAPGKSTEGCAVNAISSRCQALIHENYSDIDFSVAAIAEEMNLSASYLSRVFKQQVGIGILEYIHRYRVMAVRKILNENPRLSLDEVARQTGFYNLSALIRVFKKVEGMTPGQYRAQIADDQNLNDKN